MIEKNNFCYQSAAFFWGFHFINSVHYSLSLYSINYNPQLTWKCLTMKPVPCVCVTLIMQHKLLLVSMLEWLEITLSQQQSSNHCVMIWSLWLVPHGPTGALNAFISCFSDKTKLGLDMEAWLGILEPWFQELSKRKNYISDASLVFCWKNFFLWNDCFIKHSLRNGSFLKAGLSSGPSVPSSFICHGLVVWIHRVSKQVPR